MEYEVLYYNGWQDPPAYFIVGTIRGKTPEEALLKNADRLAKRLQDLFSFDIGWMSEEKLKQEIYVVRENGLVSMHASKRYKEALAEKRIKRRNGRTHKE